MFKAEPVRQVKLLLGEKGLLWWHVKLRSRLHTPGFSTCPTAQDIALVLFLQQTLWKVGLCWVSGCSRIIKCIAKGLPRVPWLLNSCHRTSVRICSHVGQQWRVQHLAFALAVSQTKPIALTQVAWGCKASHYGAVANLPLLRAFAMMQNLFQTTRKVSGSEKLQNMKEVRSNSDSLSLC